ncbi:hypothetical protein Tco_1047061 [Tanacetum coccineum]
MARDLEQVLGVNRWSVGMRLRGVQRRWKMKLKRVHDQVLGVKRLSVRMNLAGVRKEQKMRLCGVQRNQKKKPKGFRVRFLGLKGGSGNEGGWGAKKLVNDSEKGAGSGSGSS